MMDSVLGLGFKVFCRSRYCAPADLRQIITSRNISYTDIGKPFTKDPERFKELVKLDVHGQGNPYETRIRRKREVVNPNLPKFGEVECIKWSNWHMLKDVKRRHYIAEHWQLKENLHFLSKSPNLPSIIEDVALQDRYSSPYDTSVARLRNRCSVTSRSRGILYRYRLSRIVWRDLADHGLLSGAIRAHWNH